MPLRYLLDPPMDCTMKDERTFANTTKEEIDEIVKKHLAKLEWEQQRRLKTLPELRCNFCGGRFTQTRQWQKYCSQACQMSAFKQRREKGTVAEFEELKFLREEVTALRARIRELEEKK